MKKEPLQNINFYLREYEMDSLWEKDIKDGLTENAAVETKEEVRKNKAVGHEMLALLQKELEAKQEYLAGEDVNRLELAKMIYSEVSELKEEKENHKINQKA